MEFHSLLVGAEARISRHGSPIRIIAFRNNRRNHRIMPRQAQLYII